MTETQAPDEHQLDEDVSGALKGSLLLDAIAHQAVIQGVRIEDLADRFGYAENYWLAIVNGHRPIGTSAKPRLKQIAEFLDRSLVQVLNLAEFLEPEDFMVRSTLEDELNLVYTTMCGDPQWATYVMSPEKWDALDVDAKILISMLYQDATRQSLNEQIKVYRLEHTQEQPHASEPVQPGKGSTPAKRRKDLDHAHS